MIVVMGPRLLVNPGQCGLLCFNVVYHDLFLVDLVKQFFLVAFFYLFLAQQLETRLSLELRKVVSFLHDIHFSFLLFSLLFSFDLLVIATFEDSLHHLITIEWVHKPLG